MRARALFAKYPDDRRTILVAAVDESIWEHSDETLWQDVRNEWPDEYEWAEGWIALIDDEPGLELFPPAPTFSARVARDE